jgi:hypothetical protein
MAVVGHGGWWVMVAGGSWWLVGHGGWWNMVKMKIWMVAKSNFHIFKSKIHSEIHPKFQPHITNLICWL